MSIFELDAHCQYRRCLDPPVLSRNLVNLMMKDTITKSSGNVYKKYENVFFKIFKERRKI